MGERGEVPTVVLGPSGRARLVVGLVGGATVVVPIYLLARVVLPDGPPLPVLLLNLATGSLPYVFTLFRSTVTITADGIALRTFGVRESFAWEDLLEVALVGRGRTVQVGARPDGGVWDVPGPQSPTVVLVSTADEVERQSARQALVLAAERHGLVYSESSDGVGTSPPGGWLRKDGA